MEVKVGEFEGPFELLFHLIEKNKIDIRDIPIFLLTEQYINYINTLQSKDMESMSEFILMAATLLEIKSKMLLPAINVENEEENNDPRQELVEKLLEYKRAKLLAQILQEQMVGDIYTKNAETNIISLYRNTIDVEFEELLSGVTLSSLYKTFEEVLLRRESKVDKVRAGFNSVKKDEFTIEDKIVNILNLLKLHKSIIFANIFIVDVSRGEMITTFLAMLELIKIKKIKICQNYNFDNIIIEEY